MNYPRARCRRTCGHALIVDATLSHAASAAEREAALAMIERTRQPHR